MAVTNNFTWKSVCLCLRFLKTKRGRGLCVLLTDASYSQTKKFYSPPVGIFLNLLHQMLVVCIAKLHSSFIRCLHIPPQWRTLSTLCCVFIFSYALPLLYIAHLSFSSLKKRQHCQHIHLSESISIVATGLSILQFAVASATLEVLTLFLSHHVHSLT